MKQAVPSLLLGSSFVAENVRASVSERSSTLHTEHGECVTAVRQSKCFASVFVAVKKLAVWHRINLACLADYRRSILVADSINLTVVELLDI
jgi:hypothetical protein